MIQKNLQEEVLNTYKSSIDDLWKSIFMISRFLLIPAVIVNVYRSLRIGITPIILIQWIGLLLIIVAAYSTKLKYLKPRIILSLVGLSIFSFSGIMAYGLIGQGLLMLLAVSVTLSMTGLNRLTYFFIAFSTLIVILTAMTYSSGILKYNFDITKYGNSAIGWGTAITGFLICSLTINVTFQAIQKRVMKNISDMVENRENLKYLTDNMVDVLWVREIPSLKLLYISSSVEKFNGYTVEECMNLPIEDEFSVENIEKMKSILLDQLKLDENGNLDPDRSMQIDVCSIHKSGDNIWQEVNVKFIRDEHGTPIAIHGVSRDATKRVLLEEEKDRLQEQLQQSQKMEAIGTLAGGIAHDFNNILSAVIGYTELARMEDYLKKETKSFLDQVMEAALRAKELVAQILTFSRKTDDSVLKPVNVITIAKEVMKLLRASLPSTIEFIQDYNSNSNVMATPTMLHQVLMNIFTNAGHAMIETGGTLSISISDIVCDENMVEKYPDLIPGNYVLIEISDTGIGISESTIKRIFEPFFTTKQQGEGTGLGLSVVHGIIKQCNGGIYVNSEVGSGTTFNIYLPSCSSEEDFSTQSEKALPHGNENILLVDDDTALEELLKSHLLSFGYKVDSYDNPLEAMVKFEKNPDFYDLIISDYTMPKMTGKEFARRVNLIKPDMPIILMTGFSISTSEDIADGISISGILEKPVLRHDLAVIVRETLDRQV